MKQLPLILIAIVAAAAPASADKSAISNLPTVETATLANGLQIAVLHNDGAPVVAVQLWYHVGSKDEPRDRRGSARLLEHLMFKGSEHVRADAHVQSLTALGGNVTARSDEDATYFIDTLPADYLDYAVQLEADRMRKLLLRPAVIDSEREVVKEEVRQLESAPFQRGFQRFLDIAFTKHPYAWTAAGSVKDLDAATPDELKKFYDAYYEPNNALLVVVGKATLESVKASAEKWFGPIPKAADPVRTATVEPPVAAKRREVLEPGPMGLAIVGYHIPAARDKDVYALQVAGLVLGAGDSARIQQRLKEPDPKTKAVLSFEAGVDMLVREDPGMMTVLGAFSDPASQDPIEAALLDEVAKLTARGPTSDELRKAKNRVESGFVFSLENAQGLAEAIGRSWILTGNPSSFLHDVDQIEQVTAADVQRVAKTYLAPERATVVVIPLQKK